MCEGREILVEMTVHTEWWDQRRGSEIQKTTANDVCCDSMSCNMPCVRCIVFVTPSFSGVTRTGVLNKLLASQGGNLYICTTYIYKLEFKCINISKLCQHKRDLGADE